MLDIELKILLRFTRIFQCTNRTPLGVQPQMVEGKWGEIVYPAVVIQWSPASLHESEPGGRNKTERLCLCGDLGYIGTAARIKEYEIVHRNSRR